MAQSKKSKKIMNMVYGLGAAVVIIGALFKIQHITFGFLTGGVMLTIGLVVEAIVFVISAFEPVEEDLDWSKVYPELSGGAKSIIDDGNDVQGMLSQKLDNMLKEAKLDSQLMTDLSTSIMSFKGAAEGLSATSETIASTNKYNEQMSLAASKMESLNGLYQVQVDNVNKQTDLNTTLVENTEKLKDEMESLATNLTSLNGVYGGMLTAMSK